MSAVRVVNVMETCAWCEQEHGGITEGLCAWCWISLPIDIARGLSELDEYLQRHAKFAEWDAAA
jgi:hypothetical protein